MQRVLHITDCHLRARPGARLLGIDTGASLAAVLRQALDEARPDALLVSGDLAHDPVPPSYAHLQAVLDDHYRGPRVLLAGNHDVAAAMGALWRDAPGAVLGEWELIGFDTHEDDRPSAVFDAAAHAALLARIEASAAEHLLLACHHPPLDVGCPWLDKDRIGEGGALLDALADTGRVRGLLFGHVHQEVAGSHRGVALLGTPSTCFQFEPGSARFAIDRDARRGQPGYRWLELGGDGRLHTRVARVARYPMHIDLSDRS